MKVWINFFAAYLMLHGKVIKLQKNMFMVKNMAILAYVLFKVASGTERDVAEKLTEFAEVVQCGYYFRRVRCDSKGND